MTDHRIRSRQALKTPSKHHAKVKLSGLVWVVPVLLGNHWLEAIPLVARWMIQAGAALVEDADVIAPVPLHPSRLFARRFNQSAELARAIGRLSGKDVEPDLMQRIRATPAQVGLSAAARRRNVAGAFALTEGKGAKVAEARVLLIDDVLTTGATVEACARRLGAEGAAHVDVLTLARVVPGEALPI